MTRKRPILSGVLTGWAVAALATAFFSWSETGHKLELLTFDWRVRYCNTLQPTTPIVHLDIDDGSLERVGRWPWRRDRLADMVRAINDLGAKRIAIDLLLSEYELPATDDPRYGPHSDVEPRVGILGELSDENAVFGDLELADAIRGAGTVYLATQVETCPPGHPGSLRDRLRRWWEGGGRGVSEAIASLRIEDAEPQRSAVSREIMRLRLRDELLHRFTLTEQELAERLACDPGEVAAVLAGLKKHAAEEIVAGLPHSPAPPPLDAVLATVLGQDKDRNNADRSDILAAYAHDLGLAAVRESTPAIAPGLADCIHRAAEVVPPHFYLARAARGIGAVNFSPDIDGGVRRVPLVIAWKGRALSHLGFAVACDALRLDASRMNLGPDRVLTIPSIGDGPSCEAPLDRDGSLIIPWTATAKDWSRARDFPHISAAKVWSLVEKRREIEANETAVNYKLADVVALSKGEFKVVGGSEPASTPTTAYADHAYRRKVNEQLELRRQARQARLRGDLPEDQLAELQARVAGMMQDTRQEQQLAVSAVELACQELDAVPAEELARDAELRQTAERFRRARDLIAVDIAALQAATRGLEAAAGRLRQELAEQIRDKYVFVGFAATATGDIVTTPVDPRTNGVMCHAQVLNAFLQRRFITPPRPWLDFLLCLLLGAAAVRITAYRGPKLALLGVAGLMAAYAMLNAYAVFMGLHRWLALAGPLATAAVAWAAVTLFRQLTAEREKRFFAKQLSQYTSPAIAARLAENPEAAQAFKTVQSREITCFFSDLKGFTTITEREKAEVIQHVLNTYLERMCRVIWAGGGLINKFMGDGIMAFFNASVEPLPDHQGVACEVSLIALDELQRLKAEQRDKPAGRIFEQLEMRIGLASGLCLNGDMGSELKADYTVIGDVVNLAARLEPANKVFGTRLMVSGSTRDAVAERYEFRYLAQLQVKGKTHTAPVYEIVCRKGALSEQQREYVRRFEAGVELYKKRKWDECIVHFTRMLARRPDDVGASRYIDACQELKAFPPEDTWPGALELKEK